MAVSYSFHLSSKSHAVSTTGKVAQISRHNLREYESDHYDRTQIQILEGSGSILDDVKQIYHHEFDAALEKYNSGKRSDRQISDYLKHVSDSRSDVACEIIIQLGDQEFWQDKTFDERRQMSYIFKDQLRFLEKLVPELKVASAVIHYDEASPHMHIVGVPVAEGYKKGMEKQVAKTKVFTAHRLTFLQEQMHDRAERGMQLSENQNLFGDIDLKVKEKGRNKDIPKNMLGELNALEREIEFLDQQKSRLSAEIAAKNATNDLVKSVEMPAGRRRFPGKAVLTAEEYNSLDEGLKSLKSAVNGLSDDLQAAHRRIDELIDAKERVEIELRQTRTDLQNAKLETRVLKAKAKPERYETVDVPAFWCRESRLVIIDNVKLCHVKGFAFDIFEHIGDKIRLFIDKFREYKQHIDSKDLTMSGHEAADQLREDVRQYENRLFSDGKERKLGGEAYRQRRIRNNDLDLEL